MHAPMTSLERRDGAAPAAATVAFFHQLRRIPIEAWHRFSDADPHAAGDERPRDDLASIDGIAPPGAVARMRRAARLAACAVAARPFLSPAEFERLYRPFRMLIPPAAFAAR